MGKSLVSASLLSADPMHLAEEIQAIEKAGINLHHIDVMDGHFVPNLTFGPPLIKKLSSIVTLPLDVHLMISNPEDVIDQYISAGSNYLTFHLEASKNPLGLLKKIRQNHIKTGISIKPATPVQMLAPLLEELDLILIMSVEPGFGGQAFIPETYSKLNELRELLKSHPKKLKPLISIDGGVNNSNAKKLVSSGANCLVSGSYLYKANNRKIASDSLKIEI